MSPPADAKLLLVLIRALIERMELQAQVTDVTNQNLAALTKAINNLNEILIGCARLAQSVAGVEMKTRVTQADEDRKSDLLSNLTDNLFSVLRGGTAKPTKPKRRTRRSDR